MTSSIKKLSESEIEDDVRKKSSLDAEFVDPIKRDEELPSISYFKLFRYATKLDLTLIIIGLLSAITTGLCAPFQMLIFGKLIEDMIANQMNNQNTTIADLFLENISTFAINNSIIGAIMLVFSYLAVVLLNYSALRQIFHIRGLFFKKTLNQDISWYDLHQTGDFASRMSEDLTKLEEGLGEKIGMFVFHQVSFIGSLILAFIKGWELALICMISLPVTMVAMILVSRMTTSLAKKEMEEYGKAGSIAEEVISTIRTVIAFGGQEKENERYSSRLIFACKNNIKKSFFSGLGFGILWFLIYASYALAFWYGVGLIIRERKAEVTDPVYTPGVMITVFFSVMMGSMNFGMSSPFIENFAVACGAGAKVFSVIDSVPTIDSLSKEGEFPNTINGSITFRNVHFQYPSRPNVKILQGINLTISRGETVALVGTSGCGKSTCIQLIQRFYDPSSGTILLDNQDIKTLNVGWLRNQIGVVGQEPVLFGTTIAENIRQGYPHATQREIEEAAKKANAHDFIITLPKGYDTLVGERGAQMSGGQKQRIAIARALIRNPAILLLDEATSALDTSSEAKVQKALDKASEGRTTIIIAHRLTTIRGADKIVVISNGAVVEIGTHEELMKKQEHYYSLVTAQVTSEEAFEEDEDEHVPIQRALQRNTSIDSSGSSLNDKRSSYVPEMTTDLDDYDDESDNPPPISMLQILEYNKEEWPQILTACIGSFIMGAAMPIFAVLFGDILGTLANDDVDEIRKQTNIYAIMFVVVGVIAGVSVFLQQYMFGIAGEKLTMRLRGFMFEAILKQEIGWFDDEKQGTGSLCARLSGEAACVQGATGQRIGTVLQSLATISLAVGLSMYYEWRLGFVAMSFTPFILIATYFQRGIMMKETQQHQHSMEHANKLAVEAVSNVRTVVSLNREIAFYDQYVTELIPAFSLAKRNVHYRGFVFGAARSIMFFAYAACMMYGGHLIKHEHLHYEKVLKVSQALIMGTVSIANALAFAPNFQKGLTAAAKIIFLLNRKPKVYDAPGVKHEKWFCDGNVEYKEVTFVYPTRPDTRVLKNLNLAIQHGKTIALVGPSGCGKSTTIQLLERFYDPFAGNVLLDGKDLQADLAQSTLRSQLGIVSQEPSLFDRSIEDNIAYGDNSRIVGRTEVIEAAKNANIHNFIVSLPLGYETRLGEKATQLSGGQKQRIAIARALVRNPRVLLLDEATSALDAESEQVVQDALDKAKEGRTCITIAHRLSTIQDADVICVINRGKIAEMGTHQDLLAMRGIYFQLHSYQSGQKS